MLGCGCMVGQKEGREGDEVDGSQLGWERGPRRGLDVGRGDCARRLRKVVGRVAWLIHPDIVAVSGDIVR